MSKYSVRGFVLIFRKVFTWGRFRVYIFYSSHIWTLFIDNSTWNKKYSETAQLSFLRPVFGLDRIRSEANMHAFERRKYIWADYTLWSMWVPHLPGILLYRFTWQPFFEIADFHEEREGWVLALEWMIWRRPCLV